MADPARTAALEVLRAVRSADAYTNLALPAALRRHGLSGRDAAFATELASGTVRRQGLYDAVLAACVDRPLAKVQARVLDALRLGVHQLLAMRVPAHAAISTTVDAGPLRRRPRCGRASPTRCCDGCLSTTSAAGSAGSRPTRESDLFGHLSVAHAHPRWVVEALAAAVGGDEIEALLAADNEPPGVTLVARPGRSTRDELPGEPTPYSPYGVRLAAGDPGAVAAVAEGRAGVQDEGSQLVALALASAPARRPGRALARPLRRAGRQGRAARGAGRRSAVPALLASELQPHRAGLVRRALGDADGVLGVVAADGVRPPLAARVVRPRAGRRTLHRPRCAPAPARGALAPAARGPRRARAAAEGAALVGARLRAAGRGGALRDLLAGARRDGRGRVAPCSRPVTTRPRGRGGAAARRTWTAAGPLPGTFQLWPHRHGTDAMFGALLRRVAGST